MCQLCHSFTDGVIEQITHVSCFTVLTDGVIEQITCVSGMVLLKTQTMITVVSHRVYEIAAPTFLP